MPSRVIDCLLAGRRWSAWFGVPRQPGSQRSFDPFVFGDNSPDPLGRIGYYSRPPDEFEVVAKSREAHSADCRASRKQPVVGCAQCGYLSAQGIGFEVLTHTWCGVQKQADNAPRKDETRSSTHSR